MPNKPTNPKFKLRPKPQGIGIELININKVFRNAWPRIVAYKYANPEKCLRDIAVEFGCELKISSKKMMLRMNQAGWKEVEDSVSKVSASSAITRETTKGILEDLDKIRQVKSRKHLRRMYKHMDHAHDVFQESVNIDKKDIVAATKRLPTTLNNMKQLTELGKNLFNLDSEKDETPKTIVNLAVVTQFNP